MTVPLILQIQNATLDSSMRLADALRKAKVACVKLGGLDEFAKWVDLELKGYMDVPVIQFPSYRLINGKTEYYNSYYGWQSVNFESVRTQEICSRAPVGSPLPTLEEDLRTADHNGYFQFDFHPEQQMKLLKAMQLDNGQLRIRLATGQMSEVVNSVRELLLDWTLEMEKQGVLGEGLIFSKEDREKSELATERTVHQIHIGNVGSFVQNANNSNVQGTVSLTSDLAQNAEELEHFPIRENRGIPESVGA